MNAYNNIALLAVLWLGGLAACVLSVVFTFQKSALSFILSCTLASAAMAIGFLGLGFWTPVSVLPEVGYTWISNSGIEVGLRSNWFFLLPLLLGAAALLLAILRRRT